MSNAAQQFLEAAGTITRNLRHRGLIQTALRKYEVARDRKKSAFNDWSAARQSAAETKWDAINHLDTYLTEFASKIEARGTKVHWCPTGPEARDTIRGIIKDAKAKCVVKSKAMTAEEIHLNEALEKDGFEVVESDLGEFIVQLRKEPPYHIVFPAMHLTRDEISDLFERELGSAPTREPEELTMIARRALRRKYIQADVGITGANFAIAETGMVSITENEGNARLTSALPRVMVTLLGIEKILPKLEDLALFLPLLATAGAGQTVTGYNTLYGGPRQPGESDGPIEWHVVLLDNRRTELLADPEQRVEVPGLGDRAPRMLSRQALSGVIEPRVEEIFALVQQVIRESGHEELLSSGIVLTGGSSVMPGMVELGEDIFLKPVRRGLPQYAGPLSDMVAQPRSATAMGLLEQARLDRLRGHKVAQKTGSVQGTLGRIKDWFVGNF